MKTFLFMSAVLVGIAGIDTHADAESYPWCARYAKGGDGESCGFTTFDQCMADVSGIGGYCARNTQYVPLLAMPGPRTRSERRRHYLHKHPPAR
jgi:hypothetical protein